jgi:hypothetical protein
MLQNPDLIQHFEWDACRLSKFDEQSASWVRFYDEPWTADRFWEIQVCGILYYPYMLLNVSMKVKPSTWSKTTGAQCLCRQNKVVNIWDKKGLPCDCSLCKSSNQNTKWSRPWRWSSCWVAANCRFQLFSLFLILSLSF